MRLSRLALLPVLAGLGVLATASPSDGAPPASPAAPAAPGAPTDSRRMTDKERKDLTELLKGYLDVDSEKGAFHRLALQNFLKALRETNGEVLADLDGLSQALYAARLFDNPFEKKYIPKETREADVRKDAVTGITSVQWDEIRCAFWLPTKYPSPPDPKALNAMRPFPMIVTLHDIEDFQDAKTVKKYPGEEVIKRRFPRAANKALLEECVVYAPVATRAKFSNDGRIDTSKIVLSNMWRRYHVDFDRFVLDGGSDALLFAAAHGMFYAGVIVRGDAADIPQALVKNLAEMPVYIVGTEASAARKSLLAGGMATAKITLGTEAGLLAWIKDHPRTTPRSFEWAVRDRSAHRFAHWININDLEPTVETPSMKVEVLDTADDPNTVKIASTGVRGMTVFLNDRLVNLDKPVRLVINGKALSDAKLATGRPEGRAVKLPAKLDRNFDVMLDKDRELSVRRSRYYGFLFPVILDEIVVKTDAADEKKPGGDAPAPADPGAAATPAMETEATQYFTKAEEKEKAGDVEGAVRMLKKAIEVGETTVKPKAEARLKALESKGGGSAGDK